MLCGNDDLALGVIKAMREAGRAIPGSVSVVGFDDIPQAAFLTPALSTVRLDFTELGRASFDLLREQMGTVHGGPAATRSGTDHPRELGTSAAQLTQRPDLPWPRLSPMPSTPTPPVRRRQDVELDRAGHGPFEIWV